jgi:glycogen debranching enzyme
MLESENTLRIDIPLPRLLPGESLIRAEDIPEYTPTQPPSSLRELQRLAQVKAEGEVGAFGPSLAAIALERPNQTVSPELRKYEALFGRDSLRVALDVLPMYPLLMHATIHSLARLQGVVYHEGREEEPGRIIHEHRTPDDPIAHEITQKYGWEWPYYGSVDATPQFMHSVYEYARSTPEGSSIFRETTKGRDGQTRTIGQVYRSAVEWVENRLNANPEGLLEYKSSIPAGIENQVWRDSWDAYFHADGTLANRSHGIASVEVQQLAFDALIEAASIFEREFEDKEKAVQLRARADMLRENILRYFWVDEKGGYFALGTDRDDTGQLRQLKIRTSNMGHLLRSRLLSGEEYRPFREAIITQLFSPEMLNISGVRTLASDEIRFRPGAYHNGSVWLWDTYYCAEGLRYHGYYGLATHLADKIHTVINVSQKFPEYVRGDSLPSPTLNPRIVDVWDEAAGRINRVEQPPQEVQAWSVAADIARDYYSGRVPRSAYDARAVQLEDSILSTLTNDD